MADLREVFPVLQDDATGAGEALISRTEGEVAAAKAGLIGFSFKDSSGNVVLPQLLADGSIAISTVQDDCKHASGTNAGSTSPVDIATIDETEISSNEIYDKFKVVVSCFRESVFEIYHIEDVNGTPVETRIGPRLRVGPGMYTVDVEMDCLELDLTGATGDQNIVLRGYNLNAGGVSTLDGFISCRQRA